MTCTAEDDQFKSDGTRVAWMNANVKIKPEEARGEAAERFRNKLLAAFDNGKIRVIPRENPRGNRLDLMTIGRGQLKVQVDQNEPAEINLNNKTDPTSTRIVSSLFKRPHQIRIEIINGSVVIDGYSVQNSSGLFVISVTLMGLIIVVTSIWLTWRRYATRKA